LRDKAPLGVKFGGLDGLCVAAMHVDTRYTPIAQLEYRRPSHV
jgi:hypothetical protein